MLFRLSWHIIHGKCGYVLSTVLPFCYQLCLNQSCRFYTYNFLSSREWLQRAIPSQLLQNASVGLVASVISDSVVNVFRVIKTTKQALGTKRNLSYGETIRLVLAADGWKGLFGRGLQTRIFANALQSIVFTIIWRGLADRWGKSRVERMNDHDHQEKAEAVEQLARELKESKI